MSHSSHLLARGGAGSFTPPSPYAVTTLATAPNGGNNPWVNAGSIQYAGTTIVGWVDGSNGNLECLTRNETTGTLSSVTVITAAHEIDAHSAPGFLRRSSDGRILCMVSLHNGASIHLKISTNPDDVTAWGSAVNLDSQLGGTRYTDYQFVELSDSSIFLFYRDEPSAGTDSRWCYSKSTDGGATWAAQTQLFKIASTRSYVILWKPLGSDLIHFATTNGASAGFTKIGHFRMDGLTLARTKSDGTTISASLPLTFTDITTAYTGSSNVFPLNIAFDSSNNPVIAGWDNLTYTYHRWSGSAWTNTSIVACGTGFEYNGPATGFQPWGTAVDDGDPNVVWLMVDTGGNPSWWRYVTANGGTSFTGTLIGAVSGKVHTVVPVRHPAKLRAYAPFGTWTDYNNYSCGESGVTDATASIPAEGGAGGGPPAGYYISPTGSDSTGAGTFASPWASLSKFMAKPPVAGDTLWCRGGTYTGGSNRNQSITGLSGSAGNPISIKGYPGETATFNLGANGTTDRNNYFIIAYGAACSHWVIQDLEITNGCMEQNGIITASGQSGSTLTDWTITNVEIHKVGPGGPSYQMIYFGAFVQDATVQNCHLYGTQLLGVPEDGNGTGTDHGPPSTKNLVITGNAYINCDKGIQIYGSDGPPNGVTCTITNNTFSGCGENIELQHYMTATVTGNSGSIATDGAAYNLYDSGSGTLTASGNTWT